MPYRLKKLFGSKSRSAAPSLFSLAIPLPSSLITIVTKQYLNLFFFFEQEHPSLTT